MAIKNAHPTSTPTAYVFRMNRPSTLEIQGRTPWSIHSFLVIYAERWFFDGDGKWLIKKYKLWEWCMDEKWDGKKGGKAGSRRCEENLYFISGVPLCIHITASCHFFSSSLHSESLRFDSSLALPHPKPHDTLMVSIRKLEIGDGIPCVFLTMTQYPSSPLPSSLPKIDDIPQNSALPSTILNVISIYITCTYSVFLVHCLS